MKINRKALQAALAEFSKIADKKQPDKMFRSVRFNSTKKGTCHLAACSENVFAKNVLKCSEVGEDERPVEDVWFDVLLLKALASGRCEKDESVEIYSDGTLGAAKVVCDGIEASLKVVDSSEFLFDAPRGWREFIELDAKALSGALEYVLPVVDFKEKRKNIAGVFFDSVESSVVATDGHSLHVAKFEFRGDEVESFSVVSGVESVARVSKKISKNSVCKFALAKGENPEWVNFRFVDVDAVSIWEVAVRTNEEEYPPYEELVPKKNPVMFFDSRELEKRLKHIAKIKAETIDIFIGEKRATFRTLFSEVGDLVLDVPFSSSECEEGQECRSQLDPKLLELSVANTGGEVDVSFSLSSEDPNAALRVDVGEKFVAVVAPVKYLELDDEDDEDDVEE